MLISKKVKPKAHRIEEYKETFCQLFYNMLKNGEIEPYEFCLNVGGAILCMRALNYMEYGRLNCPITHRVYDQVLTVAAQELAATDPEEAQRIIERYKGTAK